MPGSVAAEEGCMSGRRLIGIDLAWSGRNGTGCVELAWKGDGLTLVRHDLCWSMDEIVDWIEPERGSWAMAVDAPLVVLNETGSRQADRQATSCYGKLQAGAYSANRKQLKKCNRGVPRGEELLGKLKSCNPALVEQPEDVRDGNLVFETYPHIAMVELFELSCTIKYKAKKKCPVSCQRDGQQRLAEEIRQHLCSASDKPKLLRNKNRDSLLRKPDSILKGKALKCREDKLDGLICAYAAAWLDAGGDLVGLGEVGEGVMIAPRVQGIGPLLR